MARADAHGRGLLWRIGAALVSPKHALSAADDPDNAGVAPTDLTLVLVALFAAANLAVVVKSGFLIAHGEFGSGLQTLVARIAGELQWPLLMLLGGFAVITALAGKRRDLGSDSDLACVAFVPVTLVGALAALWERIGAPLTSEGRIAVAAIAICWFAVGVTFAVAQARSRRRQEGSDES